MNQAAKTTHTDKDPLRYLVAACAANALAFVIPNTSPFVIGALITGFPMDEAGAGLVLTIEFLVMGFAALLIAPFLHALPRRAMAICAALLVAGANGLVYLGHGNDVFSELITIRVFAGVGAGIIMALANAAIAESAYPPRLYGIALMIAWLISATLGPGMAYAIGKASFGGAYGLWMLIALLVVPLMLGLQSGRQVKQSAANPVDVIAGVLQLLGIGIVGLSMMAYFAFIERLASSVGYSLDQIGTLFAVSALAGALGAGIAGWMADRRGLFGPVFIGTIAHALFIALAVMASSPAIVGLAIIGEALMFMYLLSYLFSVAAALDESGRWAAAASGTMVISTGVGPIVGGEMIAAEGFRSIGILALAAMILSLVLFAIVRRRMQTSGAAVAPI